MSQLPPSPSPIGVFPSFIAKQTETLVLKGHYLGGSYYVTTINGQPLLSVKAESASLSHRKYVYDMQGIQLCTIRRETWTIPDGKHYYAETPSGDRHILDIHSKMGLGGSKNTVTFVNTADGSPAEFFFKNNAWGTHGEVLNSATQQVVAAINREMFKVRNEYHVTVPQGIDMVVILAICIVLDDKARSTGAGTDGVAAIAGGGVGA